MNSLTKDSIVDFEDMTYSYVAQVQKKKILGNIFDCMCFVLNAVGIFYNNLNELKIGSFSTTN